MATRDWYRVVIDVQVHDRRALYQAALKQARKEGLSAGDFANLRRGPLSDHVAADLHMLLDPGISPNGCQIEGSEVEFIMSEPST